VKEMVESTTRTPADYFAFGMSFFGTIIAAAGLITTRPCVASAGVVLQLIGTMYIFLTEN
jgi:hypothetical protein